MLIKLLNYRDEPIYLESTKVVAIIPSTDNPEHCLVYLACGGESEEWNTNHSAEEARILVDRANRETSAGRTA